MAAPVLVRCASKIHINTVSGCWEWTAVTRTGYGRIYVAGKMREVHRVLYEHFIDAIPKDLQIDHLCRNRKCVNPWHLEPVTLQENVRRAPRYNPTHCPHGHEYTPENTTNRSDGKRNCKLCDRLRMRMKRSAA